MPRRGMLMFCIAIAVVSLSNICEGKNWKRVNTTCPLLERCECRALQKGATVLCKRIKGGVDLSEEFARLQGIFIYRLTFAALDVDVLPSSWFRNMTIAVFIINSSPVRLIEDQVFLGFKKLKRIEFTKTQFEAVPQALSGLTQLKHLRIEKNDITAIDDELRSLDKLEELSFADNHIITIAESAFAALKNLKKLRLQNNRLEYLPPYLFKDLTQLVMVDLHDNCIKTVHDAFQDLPFLKEIHLYNNAISDIDKLTKGNIRSLRILTAENNLITSLLDFGPINLKIEILSLQNCEISYVHPFAFRALEKLTHLDVANNQISHINGSAFHKNSRLLYFSGAMNNITSLAGTFRRTRKLLNLNVSYNLIDDVMDAFTQLVALRKLMLRKNRIKFIRDGTFINNGNLKHLDLGENRIEWFGKKAFQGLVSLDVLFVSHNSLLHFNGSVSHMPKLRILHFSHNRFRTLCRNDFYNTRELAFVYAFGNNLSSIEGAFEASSKLQSLHIQNNHLKTLSRTSFPESLQKLRLLVFEGELLFTFSLRHSSAHHNQACPSARGFESREERQSFNDEYLKGGCLLRDSRNSRLTCLHSGFLLSSRRNFVQSEWCRWEFRVAHHRALEDNTNRLIVVLVDDVVSDAVDDELRLYMHARNCLHWEEPHFWDKLLYSLPKKDAQRRLIPSFQGSATSISSRL
ncbi:unnamed protein product [Ixodes hexagonus]